MPLPCPRFRPAMVALLAAILLSAVACSQAYKDSKNEEDLMASVKVFNSMFRWGDYKLAAVWIVPSEQEAFWRLVDKYQKELRIVDFEVRNANLDAMMKRGFVLVHFRYYMTNKASLLTKTVKQEWAFSETKKTWMVVESGLRHLTVSETKN